MKPCYPHGIKDFPFSQDDIADIWELAKRDFIGRVPTFTDLVMGMSEKLGMDPYHVAQALSKNKVVRQMGNDVWREMSDRRKAVDSAKRYVETAQGSRIGRVATAVWNAPRGALTTGHWGVFNVTHAGEFAFAPSEWKNFAKSWVGGWKFVNPTTFEKTVATHMLEVPEHDLFSRAGLANDPYAHTVGILSRDGVAHWASKAISKVPGLRGLAKLEGASQRGFGSLSILRDNTAKSFLNDRIAQWAVRKLGGNKVLEDPQTLKPLMQVINHATGEFQLGRAAKPMSFVTFATKLLPARMMAGIVEPTKAVGTFLTWRSADAGSRLAALWTARRAVQVLAVYHGLLYANSAWNQSHGGPPVNMHDPSHPGTYMKFRFGKLAIAPPSAIMEMERLVAGIMYAGLASDKKLRGQAPLSVMGNVLTEYGLGKIHPMIRDTLELWTGTDWIGRRVPVPSVREYVQGKPAKVTAKHPAISPGEYYGQKSPIPVSGAVREIYSNFRQNGLNASDTMNWIKALSDPSVFGVPLLEGQGVPAHEVQGK